MFFITPRHTLEHDSIASVRVQAADGGFRTLTGSEILEQQRVHLIRVPTIEPILHPRWFLQQIANARRLHAAKYGVAEQSRVESIDMSIDSA
jgi:hypothetical protein